MGCVKVRGCDGMALAVAVFMLAVLSSGVLSPNEAEAAGQQVGQVLIVEGSEMVVKWTGRSAASIGERLEVYDFSGKRVATVQVKGIDEATGEVKCQALTGGNNIVPGCSVHRRKTLKWALTLEGSTFALEATANPAYTALTNEVSTRTADRGMSFLVGGTLDGAATPDSRLRGAVFVATGYADLGAFKGWEAVDAGAAIRLEVVAERLQFEVGGAWCLFAPAENLNWARPEGDYNDKIEGNSGEAVIPDVQIYKGWVGLNIQFSREVTLYLKGGHHWFNVDRATDSNAPDDYTYGNGYDLQDRWLESNLNDEGGFAISVGLQYWFKNE